MQRMWGQIDSKRSEIARAFTEIHHEVARAPRYFVQVVFAELKPGSTYHAGHPSAEGHIWIRADNRAGRTEYLKRALLERILDEIGAISGVVPEHIWVYICDVPGPNVAEYGKVLPHPGGEDEWFASLPEQLPDRLHDLA